MKQLVTLSCAIIVVLCLRPSLMAGTLTLTIENHSKQSGTFYLTMFDNEADYDVRGTDIPTARFSFFKSKFEPGESFTIKTGNLAKGEYAYRWFLDKNNNGVLDTRIFGIPREIYGFSKKNPRVGPPLFKDVKFVLAEDTEHTQIIK